MGRVSEPDSPEHDVSEFLQNFEIVEPYAKRWNVKAQMLETGVFAFYTSNLAISVVVAASGDIASMPAHRVYNAIMWAARARVALLLVDQANKLLVKNHELQSFNAMLFPYISERGVTVDPVTAHNELNKNEA